MNGNTYFNLRFYNPLPVQFAAADSEAHVTSGVTRRDSEPHIFRRLLGDFHSPILRTWLQKNTLFIQNRGHSEVLKKTPSSAKYVRRVRPPLYLRAPQYPPPPPPPPPPRAACIANYVVNDAWRACVTFAIWRQFLRKMNAARHNTRTLPLLN